MEDRPIRFQCDCGGLPLDVVPDERSYTCGRCKTNYYLLYVPFDVFRGQERYLLRKMDPKMDYICTEVAAKRLLAYHYRPHIQQVGIGWLQSRGCVDVHTISSCLNYLLKMEPTPGEEWGYALMYRKPIRTQYLTQAQEHPIITQYLALTHEPLIVSAIPTGNWQRLMDLLYTTGKSFIDLYQQALHTILIVGFSTTTLQEGAKLCIHDHVSNVPIDQQQPYKILSADRFEYAHALADFRMIVNLGRLRLQSQLRKRVFDLYRKWA